MVNDVELWNQVTPELQNGEELLWVGKPTPLRVVLANGELISGIVGIVMIIVVLTIFSSFRMPTFSSFGSSSFGSSFSFFSWFPLIFVAFGLFILGRPIYEFLMAGRTVYALTDQRAIIIKPGLSGRSVRSYSDTDELERSDMADGRGDLIFLREYTRHRSNGRTRTRVRKIGFFGVANVREVEALMLRTLAKRDAA